MMPLDKNESYWMLDEELVEAARTGSATELSTYPDYSELKQTLNGSGASKLLNR